VRLIDRDPYFGFPGGRHYTPNPLRRDHHQSRLIFRSSEAVLIYLTYFNAGMRIFNIAAPRMLKEFGWFILPQPNNRIGITPKTKLVQQTEDVLVDTRGNIYITDKQWGLFVFRYTGKGEPTPKAK
jgi:hypothetical protein